MIGPRSTNRSARVVELSSGRRKLASCEKDWNLLGLDLDFWNGESILTSLRGLNENLQVVNNVRLVSDIGEAIAGNIAAVQVKCGDSPDFIHHE